MGNYELIPLEHLGPALIRFGEVFPDEIRAALFRTAREGVTIVTAKHRDSGAVDTGAMLRAWRPVRHEDGGDIVNETPYGPVMEYGARPFRISQAGIDNLAEWVERKARGRLSRFRVAAHTKKGKRKKRRRRPTHEEALRFARAIAKKFESHGIAGRKMLGESWPLILKLAGANVDEALRKLAYGRLA